MRTSKKKDYLFLSLCCLISFFQFAAHGDNITYPPAPSPTAAHEITDAWDSLTSSTLALHDQISSSINKEGIVGSVRRHQRFYLSIAVFGLLSLIWLRNRKRL
jgi:hypothetical protein